MWTYFVTGICIGYLLGLGTFVTLIVVAAGKQNKQREKNDEIREWENSRSDRNGTD
jgi:hypothetical protein